MRRGRQPERPHIPDPSATIPDFGPRPEIDKDKLDEIRRLIPPPTDEVPAPAPQQEAQREPATPSSPPSPSVSQPPISQAGMVAAGTAPPTKKKSSKKWLIIGLALVCMVLAGILGFLLAAGAGLAALVVLG